mmetsp:Transcript_2981/g.4353  ORF Transcript_2981/g.4353 Transcript_2981/m.4353 type:complete len:216 (-) Transcript_2981:308-955(-)
MSCLCLNEILSISVHSKSRSRSSKQNSTIYDSIKHGDLFLQFFETHTFSIGYNWVNINDIISDTTTRLINLLQNIQFCLRKGFSDLSKHSWFVLVHNGNAHTFWSRQLRRWEIHGVLDSTSFYEASNCLCCHGSSGILSFCCRSTKMWENHGIFVVPESVVREIRNITPITTIQKLLHGLGINEFPTCEIQEYSTRLEIVNHISSNNSMSTALLW